MLHKYPLESSSLPLITAIVVRFGRSALSRVSKRTSLRTRTSVSSTGLPSNRSQTTKPGQSQTCRAASQLQLVDRSERTLKRENRNREEIDRRIEEREPAKTEEFARRTIAIACEGLCAYVRDVPHLIGERFWAKKGHRIQWPADATCCSSCCWSCS